MTQGVVSEIYSTLQGEGLYLGERQIFIRLAGCPWRCRYCDTPDSLTREGHKTMSVEDVLDEVHHLQEKFEHKTVSVTGGEPLVQADFLQALLPALRRLGLRTYLETSGTHPEQMRRLAGECDVVAMDVKLPSAIGRGYWDEHSAFLAAAGSKVFVKIVLTSESTDAELQQAFSLLTVADPVPPVVLQPVTAIRELDRRLESSPETSGLVVPPPPHRVLEIWEKARQKLSDVRLVPQMHPLWGAR
jgi:7-carboxy-7-deazaguanine synthase